MSISIQQVKVAARGKWSGILVDAGLPAECLDRRRRLCPECLGGDHFNAAKDVNETGAVFCRKCFNKSSTIKPCDGVATVAWLMTTTKIEAAKWIADRLGISGEPKAVPPDIIAATCRDKRMPIEAFKSFGVRESRRGRDRFPVCRVNLYNEMGAVHSHFDLWPRDKGRVKAGTGNSGLFFPGRLPVAGETWLAVEGVKDAAALVGLGYNAFGYCGNKLATKYARLFEGVDIVVIPDLDSAGIIGADHTCGNLLGIASSVKVVRLPGMMKEKQGLDVRDCLQMPDGEKQVRHAIELATPWTPSDNGDENMEDRPDVVVSMIEATTTDQVVQCLGNLGWRSPWIKEKNAEATRVYVRGGVLVHAVASDDIGEEGRLTIRKLPSSLVRERITQACSLFTEIASEDEVELKPTRPPVWLIDSICNRGSFGGAILPLAGIVESPSIRVDGSILQTPGYDRQTGLIYRPTASFPPVPESPTKEEAAIASTLLVQVLADFPMFQDADRSAWLSMVLSMIGRSCIDGYVPMFAVTANVRGAGKSLLVDAATLIAYGRRAARQTFTSDDNEMRKKITATAIGDIPSTLFDNLDLQLGGSALDAAITSATWSDRLLGVSKMSGDLPLRTIWSATGNNLAFTSDMGRRVLPIRLQSSLESPENRSGFVHPDLLSWIESQRPTLAVAALTILRAYFVAGCPVQKGGEWGSFESWSARIRGAIVWAGCADPLPTRVTAFSGDETAALLAKLIAGIEQADPSGNGLTTGEIELKTDGCQGYGDENEVLAEAVFEICGERFNGRKFGKRLRGFVGRVHGGKFIEADSARGGVCLWRVRTANGGFGEFGGSKSTPSNSTPRVSQDPADGFGGSNSVQFGLESPLPQPKSQTSDESEGVLF